MKASTPVTALRLATLWTQIWQRALVSTGSEYTASFSLLDCQMSESLCPCPLHPTSLLLIMWDWHLLLQT